MSRYHSLSSTVSIVSMSHTIVSATTWEWAKTMNEWTVVDSYLCTLNGATKNNKFKNDPEPNVFN